MGAAGISLSIAFRENLENLSSGVSMVVSKKVKVGEIVEVEGIKGTIEDINLVYTVINSGKERLLVPNSFLSSKVIKKEV